MDNYQKYKHSDTVKSNDYYSKCNVILNKFKETVNMNSNHYYYNVMSIMDEYTSCKRKENEKQHEISPTF